MLFDHSKESSGGQSKDRDLSTRGGGEGKDREREAVVFLFLDKSLLLARDILYRDASGARLGG